jgi:hypothetical protein
MAQSRTRRPLVAVGLGALVLAKGLPGSNKVSTAPGGSTGGSATTKAPKGGTTTTTAASTTPPPTTALNVAGTKILVANGAQVDGIAGRVTAKLKEKGYSTEAPTNTPTPASATVVYALPGAEEVAKKVAADLGIAAAPAAMPAAKPVADIKTAQVLVVIAADFKESSIPAAAKPATPASTSAATPAPAVVVTTTTTIKK